MRVTLGSRPEASDPGPPGATDAFGARPGPLVTDNRELITVIRDGLGIFTGTSGAFSGYRTFAPVTAPASPVVSEAATTSGGSAIAGYRLGKGFVVDIGLVGFGSHLARDIDAQELVTRLWSLLRS